MRKAVIPAVLLAVGAAGVLALALGPSGDSPPAPAPPPPEPPRTAETANPRTPAAAEPPPDSGLEQPEIAWEEALRRLGAATDRKAVADGIYRILGAGVEGRSEEERARLLELIAPHVLSPNEGVQSLAVQTLVDLGDTAVPFALDLVQHQALDELQLRTLLGFLVECGHLFELATGPDEVLRDQAMLAFDGVTTEAAAASARRLLVERPEAIARAASEAFAAFVDQAIGIGLGAEVADVAASDGLGDQQRGTIVEHLQVWPEENVALLRMAPRVLSRIRSPHARLKATELVLEAWADAREKGDDFTEVLRERLAEEPDATIRRRIEEALRDG